MGDKFYNSSVGGCSGVQVDTVTSKLQHTESACLQAVSLFQNKKGGAVVRKAPLEWCHHCQCFDSDGNTGVNMEQHK